MFFFLSHPPKKKETLTHLRQIISHQPLELLEPHVVRRLLADQQPEGQLACLPLVEQQLPELVLLDAGEGLVHHGEHLQNKPAVS